MYFGQYRRNGAVKAVACNPRAQRLPTVSTVSAALNQSQRYQNILYVQLVRVPVVICTEMPAASVVYMHVLLDQISESAGPIHEENKRRARRFIYSSSCARSCGRSVVVSCTSATVSEAQVTSSTAVVHRHFAVSLVLQ